VSSVQYCPELQAALRALPVATRCTPEEAEAAAQRLLEEFPDYEPRSWWTWIGLLDSRVHNLRSLQNVRVTSDGARRFKFEPRNGGETNVIGIWFPDPLDKAGIPQCYWFQAYNIRHELWLQRKREREALVSVPPSNDNCGEFKLPRRFMTFGMSPRRREEFASARRIVNGQLVQGEFACVARGKVENDG